MFRLRGDHFASWRFGCVVLVSATLAALLSAATAPPTSMPTSMPASQPTTAPAPTNTFAAPAVSDQEVGIAIERGVSFLLSSFKDGQLTSASNLSDSQDQGLDALCVYALLQSGRAINNPRLSISSPAMRQALARLCSYDLTSDGKQTNRPITYGRSLRAAALATYDRPEDRNTLKADVAWLIGTEINGAYTYDDLYVQLVKQGLRLNPDAGPPPTSPMPPGALARGNSGSGPDKDGFKGGSDAVPFGPGLYPRSSPMPPGPQNPQNPYEPGYQGPYTPGVIPKKVTTKEYGHQIFAPWPTTPHLVPKTPYPPWYRLRINIAPPPRAIVGGGGTRGGGPPPVSVKGPPLKGRLSTGGPIADNQVPPPDLRFVYPWDNSNSQYGLLGVWAGAEAGMEVPNKYWEDVETHWLKSELLSGQWAYRQNDANGYFAMTCAGVASLLVTHDYLDMPMLRGRVGRPPYNKGLEAGLRWLDWGDHSVEIPDMRSHYLGYDLFGLERIGLASGLKYFGSHDWYRELVSRVVAVQHANGSWGAEDHGLDTTVDTAYTLLFLSRGRHPVLMTKLKFGKYWDNRPHDLANLARFAAKEVERPLNWQVVGIEHPWYDWFDSPVVYVASHQPPDLKAADYAKLRNFALAGGMIFTNADSGSETFTRWVSVLADKVLPGSKLKPIPNNDPLFSVQYKLRSHPPLFGISNGVRWLLVHSPNDLALSWELRDDKRRPANFQLGTNIFLYASGQPDLRNRIDSPFIEPATAPAASTVKLARVKYNGNWDPEPAAWPRLSRYLQEEKREALDIAAVPADKLITGSAPLATLTGTDPHAFTEPERSALRTYVQSGGILLIDACGGKDAFAQSVRSDLIEKAFKDAQDTPLVPTHPLLKGIKPSQGSPLRLRPYAMDQLGHINPDLKLLRLGKGYVVFTGMDLTCGLLGTHTWGITGYDPAVAEQFAANLVTWAQDQQHQR